jgi:hypothetical protein
MCGIVGVISGHSNGFSQKEADVFTEMLFLDTLRGWDSTGVFGIDSNANVEIHKAALNGPSFIQTQQYKSFRSSLVLEGLMAVGHNRAATRGTVSDKNAHPFWVNDEIILVQNGTFFGSHKHLKDTEVDSEAIAHVLAEEPDIEKALKKVNSAYALVWFNTKTKQLNLIRNEHRPLHLAQTKGNAFLFASEKETLDYVISRSGWKVEHDPYLMKENCLVTITIKENSWDIDTKDVNVRYTPAIVKQHNIDRGPPFRPGYDAKNHDDFLGPSFKTTKNDIRSGAREVIPIIFPHWTVDHESAIKAIEGIAPLTKQNKRLVIEVEDYHPANNVDGCTAWHIFGHLCEVKESSLDPIVFHWFVTDKTEEEVQRYLADTWFYVTPGSVVSQIVNNDKHVLTCFGSQPSPVVYNQYA